MRKSLAKLFNTLKAEFRPDHADFKYYLVLSGLIAVTTIISLFIPFFVWVTLALCILFVVIAKGGRAAYVLVMMFPLSAIFRINRADEPLLAYVYFAIVVWLGFMYLLRLIKKKEKINFWHTISCAILIVMIMTSFSLASVARHMHYVFSVLLLYIVYLYRKDISLKELFIMFFIGILISFVFGFFAHEGSRIAEFVWAQGDNRYSGLHGDPNIFANYALISMVMLFVLYINKAVKYIFYPIVAVLVSCIALSGSKAAYLFLALILVVYFGVLFFKTIKEKEKFINWLFHLLTTGAITVGLFLLFKLSVTVTIGRIGAYLPSDTSGSDLPLGDPDVSPVQPELGPSRLSWFNYLNSLTTGRLEIWISYLEVIFSSFKNALFGFGINAPFAGSWGIYFGMSAHNTYIEVLYFLGVFGVLAIIVWALVLLIPLVKERRINWWNLLAVLMLLLCIATVSTLPMYLAIFLILILPTLTFKGDNELLVGKRMLAPNEPVRVLHLIGKNTCGGVEANFMNLYRNIDRNKVQFDFVVIHEKGNGYHDDEIKALGGRIYHLPRDWGVNVISYVNRWSEFFEAHPEYRIIHAHQTAFVSRGVAIAKRYGLTVITHSHGTKPVFNVKSLYTFIKKNAYHFLWKFDRAALNRIADYKVACSKLAGEYLYGKESNFTVLNNGIDIQKFGFSGKTREEVRIELGIRNEFLVIHVGRFAQEKNHRFLIDVFAEIVKLKPDAKMVMVGDGDLRAGIEERVESLGIENKASFLRVRQDVNRLLQAADVFCMPSFHEGFPVVLVEAQTCGLPVLASTGVPEDVNLTGLVTFMELNHGPQKWAEALTVVKHDNREKYQDVVAGKGYGTKQVAGDLQELYLKIIRKIS